MRRQRTSYVWTDNARKSCVHKHVPNDRNEKTWGRDRQEGVRDRETIVTKGGPPSLSPLCEQNRPVCVCTCSQVSSLQRNRFQWFSLSEESKCNISIWKPYNGAMQQINYFPNLPEFDAPLIRSLTYWAWKMDKLHKWILILRIHAPLKTWVKFLMHTLWLSQNSRQKQ